LSGCAGFAPNNEHTKSITWQRVPQAKLTQICNQGQHYKNGMWGCAIWYQDGRCIVYTLETLKANSPQEQYVLGHETMHCFNGHFHSTK